MAADTNLQRSVTEQILSPKSLFEFANSEIPGIQSFCVPTTEIIEKKHLEKRLEKSSTLTKIKILTLLYSIFRLEGNPNVACFG